jgi:hypothetical protein
MSLSNRDMLSMSDQQGAGKQAKNAGAIGQADNPPCVRMPACPNGLASGQKTVSIQQQSDETCPIAAPKQAHCWHASVREDDINDPISNALVAQQIGNLPQPRTAV